MYFGIRKVQKLFCIFSISKANKRCLGTIKESEGIMRRKRFSREQILEADQRDILGVARELNLPLEQRRNTYKVPGYGGLYITPSKNAFNCFSANLGSEKNCGGGPIQLVMFIQGCTFIEAVSYLLGIRGLNTIFGIFMHIS